MKFKSHQSPPSISSAEITPEQTYISRRKFMLGAGVALGSALVAACSPHDLPTPLVLPTEEEGEATLVVNHQDDFNDPLTSFKDITNYNNFYEFTTDKEYVAVLAEKFNPLPWTIEVSGLVNKPKTYAIEDILSTFSQEERIYRMRCVEGWSMVIPWLGFPLAHMLNEVEPLGSAKYVRFESVFRPDEMEGQKSRLYPWPYDEGLRLDEAMNDLTILSTGLYGKSLLNQSGAPIRLVVPWKYGFKSIKSIVKIELVEEKPATLWSTLAPYEYGFYSNVNPEKPHPRWSQATERRIGEFERRPTLMFNGYSEQVAEMYSDMDLTQNY